MSNEDIIECHGQLKELEKEISSTLSKDRTQFRGLSIRALRHRLIDDTYMAERNLILDKIALLSLFSDVQSTITQIESIIEKRSFFIETQSMLVTPENAISNEVTDQNFTDIMGETKLDVAAGKSTYTNQGQDQILNMNDFFNRPIKLYEVAMSPSTDINLNMDVWRVYSDEPSVRAKMRNFAYMRADMHVRITVSGLPFHYGRLLISPQPLSLANKNIEQYLLGVAADTNYRPLFLNYLSQAPGSVVVDVKQNKPVDLILPFISQKHMMRLFNDQSTAIAAGTALQDFEYAGNIHIRSLNQIKSVSASPTPAYMQVYCWLENVELGTNTGTQLAITTESKIISGTDERVVGPVESIASAVHKVSSSLEDVPVIGVFAKASGFVSGAIASVAALFGWSKPVIVEPVKQVKNQPFSNGAVTIGSDTNKKICIDPKQELTVDPRVCGVQHDDMTIKRIASTQSYLATFTWQDTDSPLVSPIWASRVHPNLVTSYKPSTYRYVQPTAMAFAVTPFAFWRGDIVFKFEVVCSAFHRGKIAVYYEPNLSQRALIDAEISLNKQFLKVIDIQETQTFEIVVEWASYRAWLLNCTAAEAYKNTGDINGTSGVGYANGYIGVVPFTKLQSPDSSDISVNVYVSSPNLQVNGFTVANMPNGRRIITQSKIIQTQSQVVKVEDPVEVPRLVLNPSTASNTGICEETFGEQILSFRSLMKRYQTSSRTTVTVAAMDVLRVTHDVYPPNLIPYTGTGASFLDLYSYLKYAYLGMKGGFRYRIHLNHSMGESLNSHAKFTLAAPDATALGTTVTKYSAISANSSINGTVTFVPHVMSAYELEVPLYTSNLFLISFNDTGIVVSGGDFQSTIWYKSFYLDIEGTGNTVTNYLTVEYATAEDFSFMRFQGAPMHSI